MRYMVPSLNHGPCRKPVWVLWWEELRPKAANWGPLTALSWSASPPGRFPRRGEPGQPWSSNIPIGSGGGGALFSYIFPALVC